jgi:hypothetical protein
MVTLITKYAENLFYDALKKRQLLPCVLPSKIDIALTAVSIVTIYSIVCYLLRAVDKGKQYKLFLFFSNFVPIFIMHIFNYDNRQLYRSLFHTGNINM